MKKILIFFMCLWALMAEDLHKPLPAKYLIEKGYSSMDIYLEDWVELEKNEIRFRDPWDYGYKDDFQIYFKNMETESEENIGYIDRGAEILSVFFKDITLDGLREIFVLSRLRGKYKIYSYHIIYYMSFYYYEINEELDSYLNKKYEDYSGELNAEIIKKEIGTKLLVDYMPVYFNFEKKYYNGEKLAYLKSTPTGYEEVEDIKESDIYVKIYDENVFAIFEKADAGFELREVFEGEKTDNLPYFVKNGRYRREESNGSINGFYKDNLREGDWEYNYRLSRDMGQYKNDMKNGIWIEENVNGKNVGEYINDEKHGVWVEEYTGTKTDYN